MKKQDLNNMELRSAGATVIHDSSFEELESYVNEIEITQQFREDWVIPFYFELNNQTDEWIQKMINLKPKITNEIILKNLGDFDWRTRSTGSYFASIKQSIDYIDIIGTHLLKSEVCYAGSEYSITLASFNNEKSVCYFEKYLQYYLKKPELYFDQGLVMMALKYLDEINNTNNIEKHLVEWENFIKWRYDNQLNDLNNLKSVVPNQIELIEKQIKELKPQSIIINTDYINDSINTLNLIING